MLILLQCLKKTPKNIICHFIHTNSRHIFAFLCIFEPPVVSLISLQFRYTVRVSACTVSPHWSLCWQYNLSTPSSLLSVSEPLLTLSRSSFWPPVVMHTWPGICLCKCMNEWNVSNSHVCTQQACRKRVIQDRWTHLFPQHELLNPLLPNKRFLKKKQPANYLSAISSLKLIIPPSVRTNLSSCVYTWMPVYNSCGECLHYLCMRLL